MKTLLLAWLLGTHSVDLSWNPSQTVGVTYRVYRAPSEVKPFKIVKQGLKLTAWTNKNLQANKRFCYRVTAWDGSQESKPSNMVCVTTPS